MAVLTSETSVNFNVTTRRYIPEDSKLHTRRRESLKYHFRHCVSPECFAVLLLVMHGNELRLVVTYSK
jgi:hypothetical protein